MFYLVFYVFKLTKECRTQTQILVFNPYYCHHNECSLLFEYNYVQHA